MDGSGTGSSEGRIAAITARQHGVVTRAQLVEVGLTPDAIDGRVRSKRLRPLHRGVYVPGSLVGPLLPPRAREMAAVLACGPGATVSHGSAASLWSITPERGDGLPVHVTVPGDRTRPGIRVHRVRTLAAEETAVLDGIPVTTPARTLLDLAAHLRARDLEQAIARAERLDLTDARELLALLERRRPRRGVRLLRSLIGEGGRPALTRSAAEERFLGLTRQGKLPVPEANARVAGFEVDFLWRSEAVAVEVDGFAYHSSRRTFESDRQRDAELAARGIQVVRVTWRQITGEPHAVLVRLARTLALAEARREANGR